MKNNVKHFPLDGAWRGSMMQSSFMEGCEVIEKRTRNSKLFNLGRGTFQYVLYPNDVHFQDNRGNWREIDNRFFEKVSSLGKAVFKNRRNKFLTEISKQVDNCPLVSIQNDDMQKIAWTLRNARFGASAELNLPKQNRNWNEDDKRTDMSRFETSLLYQEILPNVDVVCRMQGTSFKDDIVLKNPQAQHQFILDLLLENVEVTLKTDGCITAHAIGDPSNIAFVLPAAFMRDAAGNIGQVKTELIHENDDVHMLLTCDEEFLNSAVYPVVVDPLIHTVEHSSTMEDNYVTDKEPNTVQNYAQGRLRVCKNKSYGECRSFLKWTELPELSASQTVTKAHLKMSLYSNMGNQAVPVHLKEVLGPWSSQTISWNNQPAVAEHDSDCVVIPANAGQGSSFYYDISNLVRKWYEGTNYGVMFERRITTTPNTVDFVSSDSAYNKPVVMIDFISNAGMEDYMTFDSIPCERAGTAHVNLYNGNLVVERTLTSSSGNRMPVSVSMFYGTDLSSSNGCLGPKWRLNYDETLFPETIEGKKYYKYTQGDGTEHFFALDNGNTYKDMSGLSLTMTVSSSEIVIESKDGMQRHFEPDPNDMESFSHLLSINDPCGNSINIIYDNTDSRNIMKIRDGAGRETVFNYTNNNLTSILAPGETTPVKIEYYDRRISSITDNDGRESLYHWAQKNTMLGFPSNYLECIRQFDTGKYLNFTYTSNPPYRVTDMLLTVVSDMEGSVEEGEHRSYTYADCMTSVKDMTVSDGKRLIYQFNDWGNVVSVRDELGYASYSKFSEQLLPNHPEQVSKLQRSVINMLPNHDFESNDYWNHVCYDGGLASFTYDSSQKYMGTRSMKVNKSNQEGNACLHMNYSNLTIGQTYTLSAYIKSTGSVYCYATVSQGNWYDGEKVTPNGEWTRIFTTFTASRANATLYFITMGGPGTIWIDCAQLEEGCIPNRYNLLRNCDFSQNNSGTPTFWIANGANSANDGVISTKDPLHPSFLTHNCMRLYGEPRTNKGFYQDLPLSGSQGDVYVVGGWAKGFSRPIGNEKRRFAIRLAFKNSSGQFVNSDILNWNEEWTDWQYISGAVIAPCAYTAIRYNVDYEKNLNYADFDGLTLYKEEFGNTFAYDEKGNVTAVKDLSSKQAKAQYDEYNNLTSYVQPGRPDNVKTTISYGSTDAEKKKRLPVTIDSPTYIRTNNTYDAHGNPIESYIMDSMDGTSIIETFQTHTQDGNHVASETDSRGKVVTYTTNLKNDTLTKVTNANGQSINYTYDARKHIVETTAVSNNKTYKNAYTYDKDLLKTVSHNTTSNTPDVVYAFDYDLLGYPTTIKVGSQTLSTNVYAPTGDRTLNRVAYGNGNSVQYTRDAFRRIIGVHYDGAASPRFTYGYGANGQVTYIRDHELNRTIWCEYDTSERPTRTHLLEGSSNSSLGVPKYVSTLKYDEFNHVLSLQEKVNNSATYETSYMYDVENRPTQIRYGADNRKLNCAYDSIGRLRQITLTGNSAYTTNYSYLAPENTDGIQTTPLVQSITQKGQSLSYTYDDMYSILSETRNGKTTTYEYDSLGQLTRVNDPHANKSTVYHYDLGGNITSYIEYAYTTGNLGAATNTVNYVYGDTNWKDKVTSIGGKSITYDAIGNPLTYDGWTLTWKAGQMLHSMVKTGTNIQFAYDHNGMRTKKVVNGVTTSYTLSDKNIVHMTQGSNDLHFFYDAQGRPSMVRFNGTDYFYVYNLQNDVIALLDANGAQVVEYMYNAWGNLLNKNGSLASTLGTLNPFRYRGYVYDEETGLYYVEKRFYNPAWCRFLSPDSISLIGVGENPLVNSNVFAYCSNNPLSRKDESGEFWHQILLKVAVGVAVQYASDVATNIARGKTGLDILKSTSSLGDYVAAGVTAAIPGSGLLSDLARNVVSEGISVAEKKITGKDINLEESVKQIGASTAADLMFSFGTQTASRKIWSMGPQNYSSYAAKVRKKNPKLTMPEIKKKMRHIVKIQDTAASAVNFGNAVVQNVTMNFLLN